MSGHVCAPHYIQFQKDFSGTVERIRQSLRKIDFSRFHLERGFRALYGGLLSKRGKGEVVLKVLSAVLGGTTDGRNSRHGIRAWRGIRTDTPRIPFDTFPLTHLPEGKIQPGSDSGQNDGHILDSRLCENDKRQFVVIMERGFIGKDGNDSREERWDLTGSTESVADQSGPNRPAGES